MQRHTVTIVYTKEKVTNLFEACKQCAGTRLVHTVPTHGSVFHVIQDYVFGEQSLFLSPFR